MMLLHLVALAHRAGVHVVLYNTMCARNEEHLVQTVE
jgi:hypothetical protein